MGLRDRLMGAWRELGGDVRVEAAGVGARKPTMLPAILSPYRPGVAVANACVLPKASPANLRRLAETPVARRAINVVKDRVASMDWQIRLKRDAVADAETVDRLRVLRRCLETPNPQDSFRTMAEQVLDDVLVGGFGSVEVELTGDAQRPVRLWPVDGATIQIDAKWDGDAAKPRYAQATGKVGTDALVPLLDEELMYVRLNPRTHTPLGLGRLEVAFETVNQFLSAHRFAGQMASNSVVQYALWLNDATPQQHERLIRWWQDEVEGTGQVPILSCEQKPEVLRFAGGTDADLRLQWQEFLVRMIANAFDLPPMLLGVASDVNKSTAGELADEAFQSAVVPVAKLLAEHITRDLFAKKLGWREFEFCFNDLESRDEMQEMQLQTALLSAGVLTVDEVTQ